MILCFSLKIDRFNRIEPHADHVCFIYVHDIRSGCIRTSFITALADTLAYCVLHVKK